MQKNKIGVGITTYNNEHYFKALYESLPLNKIDEIIVVNGGSPYKDKYECNWIQHNKNCYPSTCRNDCLSFLLERNIDYYFLIEDDMIIKNENIFDKYIEASNISKIEYLCFVSTSWGSGGPENRTPKLEIQYSKDISLCFYPHMCNEFTFKTKNCLQRTGLYDHNFRYIFDIDNVYNIHKHGLLPSFWWFPDIKNSDDLIMNNPETQSRLNASGERDKKLANEFAIFNKKYNISLNEIISLPKEELITKLKGLIK